MLNPLCIYCFNFMMFSSLTYSVVINVLINISSPKLNNQFFKISKYSAWICFWVYSGPSSGFSSRGGQKPERGAKNQKGATFLKYSVGCMQQPVGQTWNGRRRFQMGGPGTTGSTAGDSPGFTTTPMAELHCSCKRRKCIGQYNVKICKL